MPTPKTTKKHRAIVANEYRDSDGYWIELMPGYQNGADPGCHGITEDTKKAAYASLPDVIPCACAECLDLIAKGQTGASNGR